MPDYPRPARARQLRAPGGMVVVMTDDERALLQRLGAGGGRRRIVAIAGPPGSGKSTLAERLAPALGAEILPLDGFHFDDAVLAARGDLLRKGAPHTFDLDGFRAALDRLRADDGRDVAVPVFDRALELSRAGARVIPGAARLILAEGNYLLLDRPGWRDLAPCFDLTVMLAVPEPVLLERLRRRWRDHGYDPAQTEAKLATNDLPNLRLVLAESRAAEQTLRLTM